MQKTFFLLALLATLAASAVYAEAPLVRSTKDVAAIEAHKAELREQKQELIEQMKAEKQALKEGIERQAASEILPTEGETPEGAVTPVLNRQELKQHLQERIRELVKAKMEERNEALVAIRSQFREQLGVIKDEQKQQIVEHLDNQLNELNKKLVEQLTAQVERLEEIVAKIGPEIAKVEEAGGNTTEAENLLALVNEDLGNLKTKLAEQAGKTYTPTLTTEDSLKTDVGQQHQALRDDFKELRSDLIDIKNQIIRIVRLLKSIKQTLITTPSPTEVITPTP